MGLPYIYLKPCYILYKTQTQIALAGIESKKWNIIMTQDKTKSEAKPDIFRGRECVLRQVTETFFKVS